MRQNYYKNSLKKRRVKIIQRFVTCFKIIAVVSLITVMSLVFIFSYDLLTQCNYFKAKSITIEGVNRLSKNQIVRQACINNGVNIFSVNLSATRKRLLAHPWIADAEVRREIIDKIIIKIKEHRPLAVVDLNRKFFLVNSHGEIFKKLEESDPHNLPVVVGLELSDMDVSEKFRSIPFKAVMDVLRLGQKSQSIFPNKSLKIVKVDREIGITLYPFNGIRSIKLGYGNYSDKYKRLKNVLFYIEKEQELSDFDSIDLNNLNRIVVNPLKNQSPAIDFKEA